MTLNVVIGVEEIFSLHLLRSILYRSTFQLALKLKRVIIAYISRFHSSAVIHVFMTTRLGYCNHLYFRLPNDKVRKLQQV